MRSACRWDRQRARIDVVVGLRSKSRRADREKDEVLVAQARNALAAACWNQYDVARRDVLWRKIANLDPAGARKQHVPLRRSIQAVPPGGRTRRNSGSGDGKFGVGGVVGQFVDEAPL